MPGVKKLEREIAKDLSLLRKEMWNRGTIDTKVRIIDNVIIVKYMSPEMTLMEKTLFKIVRDNDLSREAMALIGKDISNYAETKLGRLFPGIKLVNWEYLSVDEQNTSYHLYIFNLSIEKILRKRKPNDYAT